MGRISDLYYSKMVLVFHGEWARGGFQKKQEEKLGSIAKLGRDDGGIRIIGIAWRMGGTNLWGKGHMKGDWEILSSSNWVNGDSIY